MINDIKKKTNKAIEVAEDLPEDYKEKAFEVILTHLLRGRQPEVSENGQKVTAVKAEQANGELNKNDLKGWEKRVISNLPEAYTVSEHGTRAQQATWAIVTLHSRNEDGSVENVRSLIKDELGLAPQSSTNTSYTLKGLTPKYLTRSKQEGNEYFYTPTAKATQIFEDLTNDE